MGTQRLNYRNASDTGERNDPDAISPIDNGERVIDTVLNRPGENIRNRTEFVRSDLEDQMYRSDTDMRWIIQGGGIVSDYYGGGWSTFTDWLPQALGSADPWIDPLDPYRGYFVVSSHIALESILSVAQDAHHVESFYAENTVVPPRSYTVHLTSRYQAAEGGDTIRVNWAYTSSTGVLNISVTGDPKHVINIEVSNDGSITLNQLELALLADPDVVNLVNVTNDGGDTGTVIDIADVAPGAGEYLFTREQQREIHQIPNSVLQSFFAGTYPGAPVGPYPNINYLKDGDTLGIYYPYIKDEAGFFGNHGDPTEVGGRRQATLTNEPLTPVVVTRPEQLFNSSVEPAKIPQSIPICKRIGDDLVFIDGTVLSTGLGSIPGGIYGGEHQYTVDRIISGSTSILVTLTEDWFGAVPVSSGSPAPIQNVINAIVHDLAQSTGTGGSELVGSKTNIPVSGASQLLTPLSPGSVFDQLIQLQAGTNARAALGSDEIVTGAWEFDDFVTLNDYDHVNLGSWHERYPALTTWKLFYRYNFTSTPLNDIMWNTTSWYVRGGDILMVQGAAPSGATGDFIAAADDSGTGNALMWFMSQNMIFSSVRTGLAVGATFQFNSATSTTYTLHEHAGTSRWGMGLGGAFVLYDDGVSGTTGGHVLGASSEDKSGILKRLFETTSTSGQSGVYAYYADRALPDAGFDGLGSCLLIAFNCHHVGGVSGWVRNITGIPASMYAFTDYGIRQYLQGVGSPNSWGTPNPFNGWDDYVHVSPFGSPNYTGTGPQFEMQPTPYFFTQSISASAGDITLQSGFDWRGRRAFASLTVSTDSDFLGLSPAGDVQDAIEAVYACTRHVYFGNSGEASQYEFARIYEGASPFPLQVASGASDRVTLKVNTSTGDLQLSTGSLSTVYVMGTIMPTFVQY